MRHQGPIKKTPDLSTLKGLQAFLRPVWIMSKTFDNRSEIEAIAAILAKLVAEGYGPGQRYIHIHVNDAGDRWSILSSREEPRCNCGGLVL